MREKELLKADDQLDQGSHSGRELELMMLGKKPMAMFIADDSVPPDKIGDAEFRPYVENGQIIKNVYRNDELKFESRCYCLPSEEWRGKLKNFLFQSSCEGKLPPTFTSDDKARIDGILLGYTKESIERHILDLQQRRQRRQSITLSD
ncbi:hemin receptor [Agrobacterium fabrum]|uniref:hemin receptor n=1 Tax=Agrobacterium fabrum TaxID=1176649 RepID=UPI003BA17C04